MKNITFILLLALVTSCSQSKESIILKTQFKPQTVYDITFERITRQGERYPDDLSQGKDEYVRKITDSSKTVSESVLRTGTLINNLYAPLVIEFKDASNIEQKTLFPREMIIYGKAYLSGIVKLDSIVSNKLNKIQKKNTLEKVQEYFSELCFTEEKIKMGGDISQKNPSLFPVLASKINDTIYTNYELLNIKNQTGEFNITQIYPVYKRKSAKLNGGLKIIITGNGKLLYSTSENLITKYIINSNMDAHIIENQVDTGLIIITQQTLIITTKIKKGTRN